MTASNEYHFVTRWRMLAKVEEVYDVIADPLEYPRWWPSVYLEIKELEPGDSRGLGRRLTLHTKGWLPYTLRWESVATEAARPRRIAIRAEGDFQGRGVWTLCQAGPFTEIEFDWKLAAEKPLLRTLSFLLKPIFSANHRWAMARGEESLRLELARRHKQATEEREGVPAPPGPNRSSGWVIAAGVLAVALLAVGAARKSAR